MLRMMDIAGSSIDAWIVVDMSNVDPGRTLVSIALHGNEEHDPLKNGYVHIIA